MRWLLILVCACGPIAGPNVESSRQSIIGGTLALDDTQVFALGTSTYGMFCTATLIGERTLLTAAHCLDTGQSLQASNQTDVKGWPGDAIDVVDQRTHPRWNAMALDWDVGLVLLASAPQGVSPKPWNRSPVSRSNLSMVRAVGFGETHVDGAGVRYQAMVPVYSIDSTTLYLGGDDGGTATCFGDSGGPSVHRGPDGVERVVGVHSFSVSAACTGGGDLRADAVADFIDAWTREKAPTCATDAACVDGCPVQDLDCYCVTDGDCSAACPLPDTDADCPKSCLADGVCAFGSCGIPDPDCLADGESCTSSEMCSGHQCIDGYCSRTCHSNSECDADMLCTFGTCRYPTVPLVHMGEACVVGRTLCGGGICGGQSEDTAICRLGCGPNDFCPADSQCVVGVLAVKYCQGPATIPLAVEEAREGKRRCSASGGEALVLGALAALLRRRRRADLRPRQSVGSAT